MTLHDPPLAPKSYLVRRQLVELLGVSVTAIDPMVGEDVCRRNAQFAVTRVFRQPRARLARITPEESRMRLTKLASGRLRMRVRHWGDEAPSRSVPGPPKSTTSRTNGKTKAGARKAPAILNRNKRGDTAIAPSVAIVDVCLDQDQNHDLTDRISNVRASRRLRGARVA
jgi:hypothetical protein